MPPSIEERLAALERLAFSAQPSYSPLNGQRVAADGSVEYDFDGHVLARGLDLDAGVTATPDDDSRVRWLRTDSGAVAAELLAYKTGVDDGNGLTVRATHPGSGAGSGSAGIGANVDVDSAGVNVFAAHPGALGATRALLDDDYQSGFVFQSKGWICLHGLYTVDSGTLAAGANAQADLAHNLGQNAYPLGGMRSEGAPATDTGIGWDFQAISTTTTRIFFVNRSSDAARVTLFLLLFTIDPPPPAFA